MSKFKESYINAAYNYVYNLKYLAKDDLHVLQNLYYVFMFLCLLDWSCNFPTTEDEKQCLLDLIRRIHATQKGFCMPEFDNIIGNVNIPQTFHEFANINEDDFIICDLQGYSLKSYDNDGTYLDKQHD